MAIWGFVLAASGQFAKLQLVSQSASTTWVAREVGYGLVPGAARGGQVGGRGPGAVPDRPGRGGSAADGGLGRPGRREGGPDPPQRQAAGRADRRPPG